MSLTIGSLFAGIGGLELGLERAGLGPVLWQVENDRFCRSVLSEHWPHAERFEDVRTVGAGELAPVDLICGGFPCQGFSDAGHREGMADDRSGLWQEYARVIRELRPRLVVLENVPRLLSMGFAGVIGDLAACGFDAEWAVLRASDVGLPHLRERLFAVAYAPGFRREESRGILDCISCEGAPSSPDAFDVTRTLRGRLRAVPAGVADRGPDGFPPGLDRYRALGNAVVPQVAEVIGHAIVEAFR